MKSRKQRGIFLSVFAAVFLTCSCPCSYGAMGELIGNRLENDRQILSAAGQCRREGKREGEFHITGRNYVPEGTVLKSFYGDFVEYSSTLEETEKQGEDIYYKVRFSVTWKEDENELIDRPKEEGEEKQHWKLGDTVLRKLGEEAYIFRCIDQNYGLGNTSEKRAALFLCDVVIPADVGSFYAYEKQEDGSYDYRYYPGPIANFGDYNDYKYSNVRQWLKSQEREDIKSVWVDTGVTRSCMGQTRQGSFSQLQRTDLQTFYMGSQHMTDQFFILSVDEALNYKEYLWRFGVMPQSGVEENPKSQCSAFSRGYWLRTPMGNGIEEDLKSVYLVDLENGSIRPQSVDSEGTGGSIGIRPAFVLPQKG